MKMQTQQLLKQLQLVGQQLAILIDPDKFKSHQSAAIVKALPSKTDYLFVGGSTATAKQTEACVKSLKQLTDLPVILFPGHYQQVCRAADAILFLSLLSGHNPDYLVHHQVASVPLLRASNLEILPTAYVLIDGGKPSAVERVSQTSAILQSNIELIVDTALAAEYMGKQLIYLEAGSGAIYPVSTEVISAVHKACRLPIIVGGGLKTQHQIEQAYQAGASLVVVGTAFEQQFI